jgi:hypothetical protein
MLPGCVHNLSCIDFDLFIGRRRTAFPWSVDIETATISSLKSELFAHYRLDTEFVLHDTSLDFTIYDIRERCSPGNDAAFRDMLRKIVRKNTFRLSVHLLTPSKAFSSYNLKAVYKLYGFGGVDATLGPFPKLECGKISSASYERELAELVTTLNKHLLTTPFDGTNEATKSLYVYFFLQAAVSIFGASTFTICLEKYIEGIHGYGAVDYAIDSCYTQRTVGVTEVKHEDFKQGIAQNAVQLESCLVSMLLDLIPSHGTTFPNEIFFIFYFLIDP